MERKARGDALKQLQRRGGDSSWGQNTSRFETRLCLVHSLGDEVIFAVVLAVYYARFQTYMRIGKTAR